MESIDVKIRSFLVYLIDDVLASIDAHVSKHIVKHCILDLLKDRTRIVVTENRTLFYYSNQILHVEQGTVSTSDFALGSFSSEILESESSTSSELNTPINFELNNDECLNPNQSDFRVGVFLFFLFNIPNYNWTTDVFFQEIKETGSLSSRVLAVYWKAWGSSMGLLVLISLFLMQVSRNLSDAWLAHWIQHINNSNSTPSQQVEDVFDSKSYTDNIKDTLICYMKKIVVFSDMSHCTANASTNSTIEDIEASQTGYYLAIYIGIVVFNSLIALIRAFAFAYAGVKAAKFIHDRLLDSVIYVRIVI